MPVAEIVRQYAAEVSQERITAWFVANTLTISDDSELPNKVLYCKYKTEEGQPESEPAAPLGVFICIRASGFSIRFQPVEIQPCEVALFLKTLGKAPLDDLLAHCSLELGDLEPYGGSIEVAELMCCISPEKVGNVLECLNRLGQMMEKEIIPVCAHREMM
jgi:hypothetical protein